MRAVAAVVVVVFTTGVAAAQPAPAPPADPPRPGRVLDEVSETTALTLSLGGTLLSAGLVTAGWLDESPGLTGLGVLGAYAAPSFGHWYSGDYWTRGLGLRLAGTGVAMLGGLVAFTECPPRSDCEPSPLGVSLAIGGAAVLVAGAAYDVATAPDAARRHNRRVREARGLIVTPTFTGRQVGMAVAGRF